MKTDSEIEIEFEQQRNTSRNIAIVLLALFLLLGTVARIGLAYRMRDSFKERGNRHTLIRKVVQSILEHQEFAVSHKEETADIEPFYVLCVSIIYGFFGDVNLEWLGLCLLQSVFCGIAAAVMGRIMFERTRNWLATSIVSSAVFVYPFYITQSISIVDTTITCALLSLTVYSWTRTIESEKLIPATDIGICLWVTSTNSFWKYLFVAVYCVVDNPQMPKAALGDSHIPFGYSYHNFALALSELPGRWQTGCHHSWCNRDLVCF